MKKFLVVLFGLMLAQGHAQPFKFPLSYIVFENGDTMLVDIKKENDRRIVYTKPGKAQEMTVKKEELKVWKNNALWNLDIPRDANGRIEIVQVIEVPGVSKDELYSRAKLWVADYYKNAKAVTNMDDREIGIVQCRGYSVSEEMIGAKVYNTVQIEVKDNKARYIFKDFEVVTEGALIGSTYLPSATYPLERRLDDTADPRVDLQRRIKKEFILSVNAEAKSIINRLTGATVSDW